MVKVAVAGGTGGVGQHIVEAIVATGKHTVLVLSRNASAPHITALGAEVIAVSYDDVPGLTAALAGLLVVAVSSAVAIPLRTFDFSGANDSVLVARDYKFAVRDVLSPIYAHESPGLHVRTA